MDGVSLPRQRAVCNAMTIINRTHRFIFIHVPKTGGTSVTEYLRGYGGEDDLYVDRPTAAGSETPLGAARLRKHSSAVQVRKELGSQEFDSFFKFCVVRNPFVRTMSLFRFLKFNFRSWPRSHVMENINSLEEFAGSAMFRSSGPGGIMSPQIHWLADQAGASCMDFIARLENIEEDFSQIQAHLALPLSSKPLQKRNQSKGDADSLAAELASGKVVDAIRRRYASDFAFLGYSTDPRDAVEFNGPPLVTAFAR